ncbi:uncharacterized protein LY89DRAFT_594017 [Mollisia scopiformis]|uniref:Uncharacterized protein n=1 Tax=Mollisia scopiformis TaxID=149040 RepID=A0A194WV89_MOLSC|nr:uncharacterized protein LY89DRAFT_594017 [Mollisia scopiformis]KUJ11885.1 hypothetical protein LY89DRAFT_594017 [Mollisia scopiformis]
MTSKAISQGAFIAPKSLVEDVSDDQGKIARRRPSVYDAVAGRISAAGFIPDQRVVSSARDTASSSTAALPPESILFRTKNAPTRYAESDIYFSNESTSTADLPESDLLKALHCYTSDFYSRATSEAGIDDWKSLDETALTALGILIEEAALKILGETGDLVFTEGEKMIESPPIATHTSPGPLRRMNSMRKQSKRRRVERLD